MRERTTSGRREFIRNGATGLAAAGVACKVVGADGKPKSRIVKVSHADASSDETGFDDAIVKKLVDRSMAEFTGKDSPADAWKTFFSPDDIVGIKINCLRSAAAMGFVSHPCVVNAIADGLKHAGVKPSNIIVWDRLNAEMELGGYTMNESGDGVQCYGTDHGGAMVKGARRPDAEAARKFYHKDPVDIGGVPVYLSTMLDKITALVNVPLVKDHMIAGLTLSLKNHYGSIMNPRDLHETAGDPYIPVLNTVPAIRDKQRLIVTDFLQSVWDGGPGFKPASSWRENSIMVGTDPVAMDTIGLQFVEKKRKENGLEPVTELASYLKTAAKMGLGTGDLDAIDFIEMDIT
jgi:hypothetical protein